MNQIPTLATLPLRLPFDQFGASYDSPRRNEPVETNDSVSCGEFLDEDQNYLCDMGLCSIRDHHLDTCVHHLHDGKEQLVEEDKMVTINGSPGPARSKYTASLKKLCLTQPARKIDVAISENAIDETTTLRVVYDDVDSVFKRYNQARTAQYKLNKHMVWYIE